MNKLSKIRYTINLNERPLKKSESRGINKQARLSSNCKKAIEGISPRKHSECFMLTCTCSCHDQYRIR